MVELQERFAPNRLGLSRQQRPLGIGEVDALSPQPFLEQLVFSLQVFDGNQVMSIDPARHDH